MGLLVDGKWQDVWYDTKSTGGSFKRQPSSFRNWITADGSAGPSGEGGFQAEAGRYHLYVSLACPWAHRTLIMRALKGLGNMISVSIVSPLMLEHGWVFDGEHRDELHGAQFLHEIYAKADPHYTGRVTVPVLWDKKRGTIVSNESSEIIRMLTVAFDGLGAEAGNYYPEALRAEIDEVNERIYPGLNNGVYRAGFATVQDVYEDAANDVFATLDWLEARLAEGRQTLVGDRLTEADIRLFTTLVRFDAVYHGHFKCNRRRLVDYPELWDWTRALYQVPGVAGTVAMDHITSHYYASHRTINPTGIVPIGPALDFMEPTRRQFVL
ncbi:glutathione S-transferase family protein [Radicibacter daui]|uniref:glutathione S-transferase family protein n=1 Tax=Radicibacter daui TaxID=3064829 RepID=UPI004046F989